MVASIYILSLSLALLLSRHAEPTKGGQKCTEMKLRMCALALNGFSYNTTVSAMQQRNNIDDFNPLINVHCSRFTRLFVCLTHYPFCSADAKIPILLPCRSVCEDVFDNCIKYYVALNLDWPQHLNCSNFPRHQTIILHAIFNLTNHVSARTSNTSFYFKPFYVNPEDYITNTCIDIFTRYPFTISEH